MARPAAITGMLLLALGFSALALFELREYSARSCRAVVEEADALLLQNRPAEALRRIDAVDALHRCARFTEGDAPPEYAAARYALEQLDGPAQALALEEARGPLLRSLGPGAGSPR